MSDNPISIDDFSIVRKLGSGSQGAVYLAKDSQGVERALKVFNDSLDFDSELKTFLWLKSRELSQHANILKLLGHSDRATKKFADGSTETCCCLELAYI